MVMQAGNWLATNTLICLSLCTVGCDRSTSQRAEHASEPPASAAQAPDPQQAEQAKERAAKTEPPAAQPTAAAASAKLLTGKAALEAYSSDAPGVRRKLTLEDLPAPNEKESVKNQPDIVDPPEGAAPQVPEGFVVTRFVTDLKAPRMLKTAPNGDVFVAESKSDRVRVLRDADGDGHAEVNEVFSKDLKEPFGIAFYPPGPAPTHVYVANTDSVVRFAYRAGDVKASGKPQMLVKNIPGGGHLTGGGHWTRDVVFSNDGQKMFVSVGSKSNVEIDKSEARRARIFEYTPDGKNERVFASGLRNPVGMATHPDTGELWATVNERDELGEQLVPDYVTHVELGGFYGWPWFYLGSHADPRLTDKDEQPAAGLKEKVIVPDVLLQSHSAALGMAFYTADTFPESYRGQAFVALHGSWNREQRTGYKVVSIPFESGKATGEYVDFMTGFVTNDGKVWGRPVGVTVAKDGALLVSDDEGNAIWRVAARR
jgi:glucose/arabinose dehydrogenase